MLYSEILLRQVGRWISFTLVCSWGTLMQKNNTKYEKLSVQKSVEIFYSQTFLKRTFTELHRVV